MHGFNSSWWLRRLPSAVLIDIVEPRLPVRRFGWAFWVASNFLTDMSNMPLRSPFMHNSNSTTTSIEYAETNSGTSSAFSEKTNPFATPYASNPVSINNSGFFATGQNVPRTNRYFHSRRVPKGEVDKPWLEKPDKKEKWITVIPLLGIFVGLALSALLIYDGMRTVVNHKYCPIYQTDFSEGLDESMWTKEAEVGGFGNGQFEVSALLKHVLVLCLRFETSCETVSSLLTVQ